MVEDYFAQHNWSTERAAELYGINNWGADYFSIDRDTGDVVVSPFGSENTTRISLRKIISEAEERGFSMPVLLRIENILGSQIALLHQTFNKTIESNGYEGKYRGVFPIKVNQQEQVIEAIADFGKKYNHGLEAGSKPELIAAISMLNNRNACIICNGYKDAEFIDIGLMAQKMGFQVFFVIEVPGELELIIERSRKHRVKPYLGLRSKLSTQASGQWAESGGDASVFGLGMNHTVEVIDKLKQEDMLDCLQLLHYHIGSQIPNICDIRAGVIEACRIYEELVEEGAAMGYLDLGGGLAVDYDGTQTNYHSSRNYTMEEYCTDIIDTIMSSLASSATKHPTIITESGRAIVAYYSLFLFDILDVASFTPPPFPQEVAEGSLELIHNLFETYNVLNLKNIQECSNDLLFYRSQAQQLFKHRAISIRERAQIENMINHIMIKISQLSYKMDHLPEDILSIRDQVYDVYYGNFSLFQSLPDVWAIDQVFPIMPIHRLNEAPTRQGIISDITCDCDGKIDSFPDYRHRKKSLRLHELRDDEDYYLGVFLVGAYQETLGDLHNLFGDTNVLSIHVEKDGSYEFIRELEGDSVGDVLSYVEYDISDMKKRLKKIAEDAIKNEFITPKERKKILNTFNDGLRGYTYFEKI